MKVVLNKDFGGFGLSKKAYEYLGLKWDDWGNAYNDKEMRTDSKLIECVEALGADADGDYAYLVVVEIPDDVNWRIHNYDGQETIHEVHRSW